MASIGSTSAFPSGRKLVAYTVKVPRSTGSNYAEAGVIMPAGFTPVRYTVISEAASDAGTSATLALGSSGYASTDFFSGFDVKGATGTSSVSIVSSGLLLGQPLPFDTRISLTYREAGTASTAGGPYSVVIEGLAV